MSVRAYVKKRIKANKVYICCECKGRICKGELYYRHKGIWDNKFGLFLVCSDCEDISDEISRREGYEGPVSFGCLGERVCHHEDLNTTWKEICKERGQHV